MTTQTLHGEPGGFAHLALFYRSETEYRAAVAGFARAGLAAGEPVLIASPGPRLDLLRAALNGHAGQVAFTDMTELGRNPARIIPAFRSFTDAHPGRRVRCVGELVWPARTAEEVREAIRHEALINTAFAGTPATFQCLYDVTRLTPEVLTGAARTHPLIQHGPQRQESPGYGGLAFAAAITAQPLPDPPEDAAALSFGHVDDLPAVRRHVREHAARAGLPSSRARELILAVNEVATNTLCHGSGPGALRIWHDKATLTCEVSGPGHITDPLAGRHLPTASPGSGHGLYLINQLCDLTELRTAPDGTTTRLHMRTANTHPAPANSYGPSEAAGQVPLRCDGATYGSWTRRVLSEMTGRGSP